MNPIDLSVLKAIYTEISSGREISNNSHSLIVREALRDYGAVTSFELVEANVKTKQILSLFNLHPFDKVFGYIKDSIAKSKYNIEIKIV